MKLADLIDCDIDLTGGTKVSLVAVISQVLGLILLHHCYLFWNKIWASLVICCGCHFSQFQHFWIPIVLRLRFIGGWCFHLLPTFMNTLFVTFLFQALWFIPTFSLRGDVSLRHHHHHPRRWSILLIVVLCVPTTSWPSLPNFSAAVVMVLFVASVSLSQPSCSSSLGYLFAPLWVSLCSIVDPLLLLCSSSRSFSWHQGFSRFLQFLSKL